MKMQKTLLVTMTKLLLIAGGAYLTDFSEVNAFFEPMMVQAFIKGENIRTFVFGEYYQLLLYLTLILHA